MTPEKRKGDAYERELAEYLTTHLPTPVARLLACARSDHTGLCDLAGTPGLAIEAKRTEKLRPHEAMAQATRNAAPDEAPVVVTRRNRTPTGDSLVIIKLDDFIELYKGWLSQASPMPTHNTPASPSLPF